MRALVTGAAGFIGSHLSESLLKEGHMVVGVDCFAPFYDRARKEANLADILRSKAFKFVEGDLWALDLDAILSGCDVVFHLAGQPGVRGSWGDAFESYVKHNILVTQRLLGRLLGKNVQKVVFASSSSIYGQAGVRAPSRETDLPLPISPYGVTKLAAERLCLAYWKSFGLPVNVLRYFTVYGPRQRPDMAFSRFIEAIDQDKPITIYGDGSQTREFTFVDDVIEATIKSANVPIVGEVLNVSGGSDVSLRDVIEELSHVMRRGVKVSYGATQVGDVDATRADLSNTQRLLNYHPKVSLRDGLLAQIEWARARRGE